MSARTKECAGLAESWVTTVRRHLPVELSAIELESQVEMERDAVPIPIPSPRICMPLWIVIKPKDKLTVDVCLCIIRNGHLHEFARLLPLV